MDASRYNSPSRKSRFRAQGSSPHRPSTPAAESHPEDSAADIPEELPPDEPPSAGLPDEPPPLPGPEERQADEPAPADPEDALPAGLRLTRSTDRIGDRAHRASAWPVFWTAVLCLALGGAGGYFLRGARGAATAQSNGPDAGRAAGPTLPLNPPVLAEVDAAFDANKQGRFADARQGFVRLAEQHPAWTSMRIEAARSSLYEHDFAGAEKTLNALLRVSPNADAEFLSGLLQMTTQSYDKSEAAFGRAVAVDPARPDIFYFWGECLRRQGKPQDAADKFRQALIRNQYETTEGLYQLKLWLSEIQADQEAARGSNARIDADLASGHPSSAALFAGAARDIRAGRYKEAGERFAQAQKTTDPAVFRVVLQDPIFLQENFRAELAPFYR